MKLLTKAWAARAALMNGGGASLKEVAKANGYEVGYFTVLVKLGFPIPRLRSNWLFIGDSMLMMLRNVFQPMTRRTQTAGDFGQDWR